jgi:hypothetical protein
MALKVNTKSFMLSTLETLVVERQIFHVLVYRKRCRFVHINVWTGICVIGAAITSPAALRERLRPGREMTRATNNTEMAKPLNWSIGDQLEGSTGLASLAAL